MDKLTIKRAYEAYIKARKTVVNKEKSIAIEALCCQTTNKNYQ